MSDYTPFEGYLNRNPEFKRNVWLELSSGRMIAMPLILLAVCFMILSFSDRQINSLMVSAGTLYAVLVYIWGTKLAIDSVLDEVKSRTWVQQQMTPISPWKMSMGKLFGSTIYAWYGGLMCLALYVFCSLAQAGTTDYPHWGLSSRYYQPTGFARYVTTLVEGLEILLAGVTAHSAAITFTLLNIRKGNLKTRSRANGAYVIALLLGFSIFRTLSDKVVGSSWYVWYGIELPQIYLSLIGTVLAAYWSVVALNQNMRTELQFENDLKPWYWFLATTTIYCLGYCTMPQGIIEGIASHGGSTAIASHVPGALLLGSYIAFGVSASMLIPLAFLETKDAVTIRRVVTSYRQRNWKKFSAYVPVWVPTLGIAFALSMLSVLVGFLAGPPTDGSTVIIPAVLPLSIMMFIVRDISFLLWLNISGNRKTPDVAALIYLFVLHLVLPTMLSLGSGSAILAIFMPTLHGAGFSSLLAGTLEAGLMVYLLSAAWRARENELEQRFASEAGAAPGAP